MNPLAPGLEAHRTAGRTARALLGALALTVGEFALAADGAALAGRWEAAYLGPTGLPTQAEITIDGASGTWRQRLPPGAGRRNNAACIDRPLPMTVQTTPSGDIALEISGSKALPGCPDFAFTVKVVDDKTLEGQFGNGHAVRLTR